jgi:hypothetical protein
MAWRPHWALVSLAAVLAVAVGLLGAGPASAATTSTAQNAVGASNSAVAAAVGPTANISAGQRLGSSPVRSGFVVATGVAANTATAAKVVPYSPQVASRNLLSQAGEGYATTPGGRTVSAHAADRIVNGGPGRPPTTLTRVDDILDNPTALRYEPVRDTVRVGQGKDFVVVSGTGQHVVTVMVR